MLSSQELLRNGPLGGGIARDVRDVPTHYCGYGMYVEVSIHIMAYIITIGYIYTVPVPLSYFENLIDNLLLHYENLQFVTRLAAY